MSAHDKSFPCIISKLIHFFDSKRQPSFPAPLYYYEIVCFLTFNVASMIGNFVTLKAKCPGPGKVWIVVVLRTFFIPIFMFCNYKVIMALLVIGCFGVAAMTH